MQLRKYPFRDIFCYMNRQICCYLFHTLFKIYMSTFFIIFNKVIFRQQPQSLISMHSNWKRPFRDIFCYIKSVGAQLILCLIYKWQFFGSKRGWEYTYIQNCQCKSPKYINGFEKFGGGGGQICIILKSHIIIWLSIYVDFITFIWQLSYCVREAAKKIKFFF